ncbi:BspA family leucine-rich repeat surface protein [Reichenbachiella sp.]|uniref:BspA family leucine-rich repeat surface protein n=1 Tax=Reichenbachiella sp. TaxID=2184521 RepID=UPI003BAE40C7
MKVIFYFLSLRLLFFLCLSLFSASAIANTYTVSNNNDSGTGSLRQAILDANANSGADQITFSGSFTITIDATLQLTDDATTIDAGANTITIQPGNTIHGLEITGANCIVRGLHMRGFSGTTAAIYINGSGATNNEIYGCRLGVASTGNATDAANFVSILIDNGAIGTRIGDGTLASCNVIGNNSFGIRIRNSSTGTIIMGNYIGLSLDGDMDLGNTRGIDIFSTDDTVIGGASTDIPNYIGFNDTGIYIQSASSGTEIVNNYLGLGPTGVTNRGNDSDAIWIRSASPSTEIGDGTIAGRNYIAGNGGFGINLEEGNNTRIMGNVFGLGTDGNTPLANSQNNIHIQNPSASTFIGDGTPGARNIISNTSGVSSHGITIGSGPTYVYGNYIGTNENGDQDRGNMTAGINIQGGSGIIGGSGLGNIISGNSYGIGIGVGGFTINENYIGTNASGTLAIPNDNQGIRLSAGTGTSITNNLISGNTLDGILVEDVSTTGNNIHQNKIGTQTDGISPLGNGGNGILVESQATGSSIMSNSIVFNSSNGIEIGEVSVSGINNHLLTQNSIYNNTGAGILITNGAQNGVTPPVITSTLDGLIVGTSTAGAKIEIFADSENEGQQYLGTTDADGSGDWSHQISVASISAGLTNISATQTASNNTSQFISEPLELSFITTWTAPSNGELLINKLTGTYNYNLVWTNLTSMGVGDGSVNGQTDSYTITGLTDGHTYELKISGLFPWMIASHTGAEYIQTVEQWGTIEWSDMTNMLAGSTNLVVNATDAPDLSNVINLDRMFWNCPNLTGDFNHWDVSNITSMYGLFQQSTIFDEDLSGWDVSSVQNMSSMFRHTAFDQDISGWEVDEVTDMSTMFMGTPFNQDISGWEVSKVTSMSSMFSQTTLFNQDLSAWGNKLGMLTHTGTMFIDAEAFDQSLAAWDIGNVDYMVNMLTRSNISQANYDATLIAWAALPSVQPDVTLGATGLTYCASTSARQSLIDDDNWTFDGDISNCPTLSYASAIDLTNYVSHDGSRFNLNSYESSPSDMAFSADGTKMYVVGTLGDEVNQFDLATPFETTSGVTHDGTFGGLPNPYGIAFNADGSKMYILTSTDILQYSLSVPFDINTTPTSDGSVSISTDGTNARGLCFNRDGSMLYVVNEGDDEVNQYTVTSPFDLTGGISSATSFDVSEQNDEPQGITFNQDGSKIFIIGKNADAVYQYVMPTSFDLSATPVYEGMHEVVSQQSSPTGLAFNPQGSKLYVVGNSLDNINQYTLGDAIRELDANDGSVAGSIIISLEGDTFTPAGGTLTYSTDYTISNDLLGLTPTLSISADGTQASLTLSGNASSHDDDATITDIEFTFGNSAFTSNDVSSINNATAANSGFGVTFFQSEYEVTTTADAGLGSLRQAILDARDAWHPIAITFDLAGDGSGTSWTINPTTEMDEIRNNNGYPINLDATTQTGWNRTLDRMIVIQDVGDLIHGISIDGDDGHEIYGLKIQGFDYGIYSTYLEYVTIGASGKSNVISGNGAGIYSDYPNNNSISYNYIGTDVLGATADPNDIGLDFGYNYSESYNNYFTNNVISGNTEIGLAIAYSDNFVQNNKIGVSEDESTAIPNDIGIWVEASGFIEDNVIAGNTQAGIWMQTTRNGNEIHIRRNYIGRNTSDTAIPNGSGILSEHDDGDPPSFGDAPIIGGALSEANYIAYNLGPAIELDGSAYTEIKITNNSIYENGAGIDLLNGADGGVAPPIITAVSATTISGTITDDTAGKIHIYEVDPVSGNQGKILVDSADVNDFTWSVASPPTYDLGKIYTATATTDSYGTTEFYQGPTLLNATQVTSSQFIANWVPVVGATDILVDVDDNEDFSSPMITGQSIATGGTATVSTSLTEGVRYYYRLQANLGGSYTPISKPSSFMMEFGNALNFDGSDDVVNVPNHSSLQIATTISLMAWVKRSDLDNLDVILEKGDDWTVDQTNYGMAIQSQAVNNGMFYFYYAGGWYGTSGVNDTGWHHYAAVATEGATSVDLYIDGVLQPVEYNNGASTVSLNESSTDNLSIGAQTSSSAYFSSASIDEVSIWNVALNGTQINSMMNALLLGNETDLAAYYKFDQGIAEGDNTSPILNMLSDRSQNQNDGTLFGFTLSGNGSNWVSADHDEPPAAPTNLRVVDVSPTQIDLFWDDNSYNETDFRIEVADGSDYDFEGDNLIITTGANATSTASYSITSGLSSESNYLFKVRATNAEGQSQQSDFKAGTTITYPGNALNFEGSGEYVDLDNPDFTTLNALTVETWIKPSHIATYDEGEETVTLIGKGSTGGAGTTTFALVMEGESVDNEELFALVDNGSSLAVARFDNSNGFNFEEDEWRHVAFTWSDGNSVRLYVDGVEVAASSTLSGPLNGVSENLLLGTSTDVNEIGYAGSIDEVRIWTIERTPGEIQSNMSNPLTGTESGLMAYYRFDQGDANEDNTTPMIDLLPDRSTNRNNGTLMDFALTGNNSNWVASSVGFDPYTVINTNDDGVGSLRWAIENANASTSKETISFNITESSPWDIVLESFLPTINNSNDVGVIIDATTQPGWTFGDANAMIILDGATNAINGNGLTIEEPNVEIYGLAIDGFFRGIRYNDGSNNLIIGGPGKGNIIKGSTSSGIISAGTADNMIIQGNYIGLDYDGLSTDPNLGTGIYASGDNILIGGNSIDGEGNVISGNGTSGALYGISIEEGDNVQIYGNLLGTDKNGENDLGNLRGIRVRIGVTNARIGGQGTGQGNVIAGTNSAFSVHLEYGTGTIVDSNIIGLNSSGTVVIPNLGNGIDVDNSVGAGNIIRNNTISGSTLNGISVTNATTDLQITNNFIGTSSSGTGGASYGNQDHGISFNNSSGTDNTTQRISIHNNVISGNGGNGIHFDAACANFVLTDNSIGVETNGMTALGNLGSGIELSSTTTNIELGGSSQENIIANNTLDGIRFEGLSQQTSGTILGINSYFCNDQNAINFTNTPAVTEPIISSVTAEGVSGTTTAFNGSTVDVYQINTGCADNQGAVYIGESTVFDGNWNYNMPVDPSQTYVATVTDVNNGISEFSASATASLVNGVIESDYDALVALYNAADGENWITNTHWLSAEDVSDWYGVTVVGTTVTAIDLCENELDGIIPDDLIDLGSLTSLLLTGNQLTVIPDLSSMPNLSILNVAENQMDFEDILPNVGISTYQYAPQSELMGLTDLNLAQCEDLDVSLSTNGTGNSFQWIKDDESISGQTSENLFISDIKPEDEGTYKIQVTNSEAPDLTLTSVSFELTIEAFIPTITEVTTVFAVTELAASEGDSYQWYEDGGAINGETTSSLFLTHEYSTSPAYTVEVTLNGCTGVSEPYLRAILSTPTQTSKKFEVFPNPTSGQLIIKLNESNSLPIDLRFFNITGVELFSINGVNNQSIDLSHLNKGVYFIQSNVETEVIRIVKQ